MVTHSWICSPSSLNLVIYSMSSSWGTGSSGFFEAFNFLFFSIIASLAFKAALCSSTLSSGNGKRPIKSKIGLMTAVLMPNLERPIYSSDLLPFSTSDKDSKTFSGLSWVLEEISKTLRVAFAFNYGAISARSSSVRFEALMNRTCNFLDVSIKEAQGLFSSSPLVQSSYFMPGLNSSVKIGFQSKNALTIGQLSVLM